MQNLHNDNENIIKNSDRNISAGENLILQNWKNFPIAAQTRFFSCDVVSGIKKPMIKGWNLPENQKILQEVISDKNFKGYVGFDIDGHNLRDAYLFFDFDHVLNADGEFVNETVAEVVKNLQEKFTNIYIEISISGTGLHAFLKPTQDAITRFGMLSKGKTSTLYFDAVQGENAPKLEIFYNTRGRFCLITGNKFSDGAEIPSGEEVDEFLKNLLDTIKKVKRFDKKQAKKNSTQEKKIDSTDPPEFTKDLALALFKAIDGANLSHNDWLPIVSGMKNLGFSDEELRDLCKNSPRYVEKEFTAQLNCLSDPNFNIEVLIGKAKIYAPHFDIKKFKRDWYKSHPEFANKNSAKNTHADETTADELKNFCDKLREVTKQITDFETEKDSAIEKIKSAENFSQDSVFAKDMLTAAAFAKIYDSNAFINFKASIKNYIDANKSVVTFLQEWQGAVKEKITEIKKRWHDLQTRKNEILAKIKSLNFQLDNSDFKFETPEGYALSKDKGIEKVVGDKIVTICRRPVIICEKSIDTDAHTHKLTLAFLNEKWLKTPATGAEIIFNARKLIDLAAYGLPITSVNANSVVEYLDAFKTLNELHLPTTYNVSRCGWHIFNDTDIFVDPRRNNSITVDGKIVEVVVDSASTFAKSLTTAGTIEEWKKAYDLAKNSPVARLIVAAAITPPLLKILGERNFLLYIHANTRAGKTTAVYLAASTFGDEKVIRSFDATKNGLAGAAADVNDYAFLVDEKQVADKNLKENISQLIYSLANGIGRTKLNKDSTLKKLLDWRTIAVMTGETELTDDTTLGGANTRCMQVAAPSTILDAETCKQIRDIIKKNFGVIFPKVIDKIFEIGFEELREMFKETVKTFSKTIKDTLAEYCRYMAVLTVADTLLNIALGVEENQAFAEATDNAQKVFPMIPTLEEISDTPREKNFVLGFILQNQKNFVGATEDSTVAKLQKVLGIFEDDFVYLSAEVLKQACKERNFDYQKLVADLVADNFFLRADTTPKDRKKPPTTVTKTINQATARFFRIPKRLVKVSAP